MESPLNVTAGRAENVKKIDYLKNEHKLLLKYAAKLNQALAPNGRRANEPAKALNQAKNLCRMALLHVVAEDSSFYRAVLQTAEQKTKEAVERLQAKIGTLDSAISQFENHWTEANVDEEFSTFKKETFNILKLLNLRIQEEEKIFVMIEENETVD